MIICILVELFFLEINLLLELLLLLIRYVKRCNKSQNNKRHYKFRNKLRYVKRICSGNKTNNKNRRNGRIFTQIVPNEKNRINDRNNQLIGQNLDRERNSKKNYQVVNVRPKNLPTNPNDYRKDFQNNYFRNLFPKNDQYINTRIGKIIPNYLVNNLPQIKDNTGLPDEIFGRLDINSIKDFSEPQINSSQSILQCKINNSSGRNQFKIIQIQCEEEISNIPSFKQHKNENKFLESNLGSSFVNSKSDYLRSDKNKELTHENENSNNLNQISMMRVPNTFELEQIKEEKAYYTEKSRKEEDHKFGDGNEEYKDKNLNKFNEMINNISKV